MFLSYAHADDRYRTQLWEHLSLLHWEGLIVQWDDTRIDPGQDWHQAIHEQLETADVILLLISPSFLASDFCFGQEMWRALQRHDEGSALVVPILARPADWERAPFSKLQALPPRAKPISEWGSEDQAFREVATGVRRAILGDGDGRVAAPVPEGTTNAERRRGAERAAAMSVAVMLLSGVVGLMTSAGDDPRTSTTTATVPMTTTTPPPPPPEPTTSLAIRPAGSTVPVTTRPAPAVAPPSSPPVTTVTTTLQTTTTSTPAPSLAQWEALPDVNLTNRCSATRTEGNFLWQVCVVGARGMLVARVTSGASHTVETVRVSTFTGGTFTPGRRCPRRVFAANQVLVCFAESRPYVAGQVVQGYGAVVHDGIVEEHIYSVPVTL